MIKRLVKLTFRKEALNTFFQLLDNRKNDIRQFPGCLYLEVFQDKQQPNIVFTYSFWTDETALENYRHSTLFKTTWQETKVLFSDRPEAHTLEMYEVVREQGSHL